MKPVDSSSDSLMTAAEDSQLHDSLIHYKTCTRNELWITIREGRRFILKGLPMGLRTHPEEVARLRKEYSLGIRINHPHVAGVYGFEDNPISGPSILMEYVDGMTLHDWLRKGSIHKLGLRLRIATQIADALAYIHSLGISHRDLKPDNIIVTHRNDVKIIDVGLGDSEEFVTFKLSLATKSFGAPEQQIPCIGEPSADVYSFGKLIELLLPEQQFRRVREECLRENPEDRPFMSDVVDSLYGVAKSQRNGIKHSLKIILITTSIVVIVGSLSVSLFFTNRVSYTDIINPEPIIEEITEDGKTESDYNSKVERDNYSNIYEKYIKRVDDVITDFGCCFDPENGGYNSNIENRTEETFRIAGLLTNDLEKAGCIKAESDHYLASYWAHVVDSINKIDKVEEYLSISFPED